VSDDLITHAVAERHSTEDRFHIAAKVFVDCTGDGQLGVAAGAPYRHGREGADEYGEDMAVPEADGKTLGSTLLFQARDMGRPMPFVAPTWARSFSEDDLRFRPHGQAGIDRGLEYGYWWAEWGGELDTIKQNETIRDELLAVILGVWDHIKNRGDHGAENWALDWFSFLPGKRESRRFIGQYVLRQSDLTTSCKLDDAIAYGGWSIDTHPPEGIDAPHLKPCHQPLTDHIFDIPLRSCVAENPGNLMFAGRNISASHIAFASTRVMATCAVIGQGVGTTAAYAVTHDRLPSEVTGDADAVKAIQQRLLRDDVYLIGHANDDPADLARSANISSSCEQVDGGAANVISGQTRAVHGEWGAPPERSNPGTHRWMSDANGGLPAWLEPRWTEPIYAAEVQIIFDSGLHRPLTLSHSDAYSARMEWGQPQPETVSDYVIEGCVEGEWRPLVKVVGNYQRRRVHDLPTGDPMEALRITVTATNGIDHARICEVRVHGKDVSDWR
jgi:hypothetical protein